MKKGAKRKIAISVIGIVLNATTLASGTYAWFAMNQSVEASVASFAVSAPPGVQFDLYYLRDFTVNETTKDGNYNTAIAKYAGYEKSYTAANFVQITLDSEGNAVGADNPMAIDQLWPAHRLTYACVIKNGTATGLNLESWDETTSDESKTDADTHVSLSWAIDIYGSAYSVPATDEAATDVETGYRSYRNAEHVDAFTYAKDEAEPEGTISVIDSVPACSDSQRSILYFTIEFSNDSSTFYTYNADTGFYTQDSEGNSNCYELLQLTSLLFSLGS